VTTTQLHPFPTRRSSDLKGVATLQSGDITQDQNEFHLRGAAELPRDIHDFGRAPATVDLAATIPDLGHVTASMPQKISGAAEIRSEEHTSELQSQSNLVC